MQREIRFDQRESFISELKELGITRIVFAEVNEKRAVEVEPSKLQVSDVVELEILAYRDSTIYKYSTKNEDADRMYEYFTAEGFEILRRSRNIT
jgi:hypothetical protein